RRSGRGRVEGPRRARPPVVPRRRVHAEGDADGGRRQVRRLEASRRALPSMAGSCTLCVEVLRTMRARRFSMVGLAALGAALLLASTTIAGAGGLPTFTSPSRADTGEGHNEPATIIDRNGVRYVAYQGGSQLATTTDGGRTWKHFPDDVLTRKITPCTTGADDIGDVELATDQAGRTYFADLQATAGGTADNGVQPVVAHSNDAFLSYNGTCAAHQPFMVDREWVAAYTPPGKGADDSRVYL